jgi:hypothetical protein
MLDLSSGHSMKSVEECDDWAALLCLRLVWTLVDPAVAWCLPMACPA